MTTETAQNTVPTVPAEPIMWWGLRPADAIAGWSARAIAETVRVPVTTPHGRHKRVGGRPQYRSELRASLLHDRQGSFGLDPVRSALVTNAVNTVVLPWVNQELNELPAADLDLGGGLLASFRRSGGYVYITVLVLADDAGWEAGVWSNSSTMPIPAPGDRVFVRMNRFGTGTVVRRFVESGYTGVVVIPDARPDWHIEQNPTRPVCMVFGAEIRPLDAAVQS